MNTPNLGNALGNLLGGQSGKDGALLGSLMGNLQGGSSQPGADVSFFHKVISHLHQRGLEDHVSSWVGTGANKPLTGEQLARALPDDALQKTADEHGLDKDEAAQRLAKTLPLAVDKLTPTGQIPQDGSIEDAASEQRSYM